MKKEAKADQLHAMRHSLAHIMAASIQKLWPNTKFGVGPVVDNGFYYDVDLNGDVLTADDLGKIEAEMRKIIEADLPFEQFDLDINEAIEKEKAAKQDYKVELLEDLKSKGTTAVKDVDSSTIDSSDVSSVSYYRCSDFEDLCRGPHVESTSKVGAFSLHKLAGAYWRGDESKSQLQRVYGLAFTTQEELDEHLANLEEAESRDHRKLGQALDLFTFSDLVGSGLPLFTPKGALLRSILGRYSQQLKSQYGFEDVWTPHITKTDLYKASGHWDKFGDEQFLVTSQESSDELALKPMNCPHHIQIYASKQRSYRDLPIKYMENSTVYRDEKSGELHGLSRVRSITMDDSHAFVTDSQIQNVMEELINAASELYQRLDMELKLTLSFKDGSDKWLGDSKLWEKAQETLETVAKNQGMDYELVEGEAAFYGPKIDFIAVDGMRREWQVATVQLDFVQPQRFELEYVAEDGSRKTPVMIHCALLGSLERFLSVYIEHTGGRFPFWLAPEQVRILTVNDEALSYAEEVSEVLSTITLQQPLKHNDLRFHIDDRNESLGKKIREAETEKIPLIIIVGPKDAKAKEVSIRAEGEEQKVKLDKLADFLTSL